MISTCIKTPNSRRCCPSCLVPCGIPVGVTCFSGVCGPSQPRRLTIRHRDLNSAYVPWGFTWAHFQTTNMVRLENLSLGEPTMFSLGCHGAVREVCRCVSVRVSSSYLRELGWWRSCRSRERGPARRGPTEHFFYLSPAKPPSVAVYGDSIREIQRPSSY